MTTDRTGPRGQGGRHHGVWRAPTLLAGASVFGLVSALLADGIWDALSWATLGAPLAIAAWHATRPVTSARRPARGTPVHLRPAARPGKAGGQAHGPQHPAETAGKGGL